MNPDQYTNQIIAEFPQHDAAAQAVELLGKATIDMKDISIVGRDYHTEQQPVGYVNAGDRMITWGKFGAFWGTIWGLLFGSAVVFVPGVGALLFAGWFVTAVAAALEGALVGGGLAALGAAFASIGIPKDTVVQYQTSIEAGNFLVIVRGGTEEIAKAKSVLETLSPTSLNVSDHRVMARV